MFRGGAGLRVIICSSGLAKKVMSLKPNRNTSPHALNRPVINKHEVVIFANNDGTNPFSRVSDYDQWFPRRKLVHSALISMCTSTYINDIVDQIMYKTVFPEIDQLINNQGHVYLRLFPLKNNSVLKSYTDNNEEGNDSKLFMPKRLMQYCAFNSIFHSSFGYSADIDDKDGLELRRLIGESFQAFGNIKVILWNIIFGKYGLYAGNPTEQLVVLVSMAKMKFRIYMCTV